MTAIKPWRAAQFAAGYAAEFLPAGQRTWRIVRRHGEVLTFHTAAEAKTAAERAYHAFLAKLEPEVRSTIPVDPERLASKIAADAETWLRSRREDIKRQSVQHRAGRRPLLVLPGRAG